MSHESFCSFCESLPGTPTAGWGGSASRCPMCKQKLWVSQAGVTYRLTPDQAAPASRGKWVLTALSVVAAIGLLAGLGQFAFYAKGTPPVEPAPRVEVAQPIPRYIDVQIERAGPSVQAKPGPVASSARVKPLPPPVVKA